MLRNLLYKIEYCVSESIRKRFVLIMNIKIIKEPNYSNSVFIYIKNFLSTQEYQSILMWLDRSDDFKCNPNYTNTGYSRLQKWYNVSGEFFCPKWKNRPEMWKSFSYNDKLIEIQNKVQTFLKSSQLSEYGIQIPTINSCLINKYRDGNDYIRPHRDTDKSFGEEPTIIGLSLGARRKIKFRRVVYNGKNSPLSCVDNMRRNLNFSNTLDPGSLFIMAGSSQRFFSHEIPKTEEECGRRYSLTFREFIG